MSTMAVLMTATSIILVIFVLPTTCYNVTVRTTTEGPYPVNSQLTLTCKVDPAPPTPVSYRWYTSVPHHYISAQNQNVTVYIRTDHPNVGRYFCHVFSNKTLVGVGSIKIQPQGFILGVPPTDVNFKYGSTVVLEVNISSNYIAQNYIEYLQWYHDGNPVPLNCSSDSRVYTNTRGTRLTIDNAGRSDEGVYVVKIQKIRDIYESASCLKNILYILEQYYAAHSPVVFIVSASNNIAHNCTSDPNFREITLKNLNYISVMEPFDDSLVSLSYNCSCTYCYSQPYVYHNGTSLVDIRAVFQLNSNIFTMNVSNVTLNDLGSYEVLTQCWSRCVSHYFWRLSYHFWGFLLTARRTFHFQLQVLPQILFLVRPPHVYHNETDSVTFLCTAQYGTPDVSNIILIRNDTILKSVVGSVLEHEVSATRKSYGLYTCTIQTLYSALKVQILLKEKTMMQFLLSSKDATPTTSTILLCTDTTKAHWNSDVSIKLRALLQTLCSCLLTNDTINETNVTCLDRSVLITASLVYASEDSTMMASDLIDLFQSWLVTTDDNYLTINEEEYVIVKSCPVRVSSLRDNTCKQQQSTTLASGPDKVGIGLGSLVGGVITGILISALTVCIIRFATNKNKTCGLRSSGRDSVAGQNDVELNGNAAYLYVPI